MDGRATLTMEMSSTTMNWARHTMARTILSASARAAADLVGSEPSWTATVTGSSPRSAPGRVRSGPECMDTMVEPDGPTPNTLRVVPGRAAVTTLGPGQWDSQASGSVVSLWPVRGSYTDTMSAMVTSSRTARRLARTATQTSCSRWAGPS